jgi:hypothetical protein
MLPSLQTVTNDIKALRSMGLSIHVFIALSTIVNKHWK